MVDLNELLKDHPYNPNSIRHLVDEIKWAMTPFDPKEVTVLVDREPDFDVYKIEIWVKTLPGFIYYGTVDISQMRNMFFPEHAPRLIGLKAGAYFRSIRIEPDDNIILGEN